MLILALDTATTDATSAVVRDGEILCEHCRAVTTHSEGLLSMIDETLRTAGVALQDLDAVVCGEGPGSFTGLRIGMATAKGLCLATGKPLVCVGSMQALALAAQDHGETGHVATILDARRSEVFYALWSATGAVVEPRVCRPEAVAEHLPQDDVVLVGDGAVRYAELLVRVMPGARLGSYPQAHRIRAGYLALAVGPDLGQQRHTDLAAAVPVYLRAPDIRQPKA